MMKKKTSMKMKKMRVVEMAKMVKAVRKKMKNPRIVNKVKMKKKWMKKVKVPILWTQMNYHRSRWRMTPNHQRSRP